MPQSKETRAIQHLLVQGFEILPCYAAVSTLLVAPSRLHSGTPIAICCGAESSAWAEMLPDDEPLKEAIRAAAQLGAEAPHAVCCAQGACLVVALDPAGPVRDALARIRGAIETGRAPPAEKLEAFGDEALEAEYKRRARQKEKLALSAPGETPRREGPSTPEPERTP